jgi:maltose-binding protein MalE
VSDSIAAPPKHPPAQPAPAAWRFSAVRAVALVACIVFCSACHRTPDTRTHIRIWHQKIAGERDVFDEFVRGYNAAHPDRVVEALYKENEELRNLYIIAAVAGQGPDLIYGPADNVGVLVTTKTIRPLNDIFSDEFFSRFTPRGLVDWQGSHWLAGDQIGNHLTLVYNRSLDTNPPKNTRRANRDRPTPHEG